MSYRPDTLEGIIEFCEAEGQPHESLLALAEVVKAAERLHTCQKQDVPYRENQLGRALARLDELEDTP